MIETYFSIKVYVLYALLVILLIDLIVMAIIMLRGKNKK